MNANPSVKNLIKILIGAAWIDGQIQPEERDYLNHIADEKGVADDPEIQLLLHEFRVVKPEECYSWLNEYLGDHPNSETCQQLLEAISGLVYSDGTIDNEEAKLLTALQNLDLGNDATQPGASAVLNVIRNLYQGWIAKLNA
jgi:uncharacterized membrane protein YebE (DUF533 family)